MATQPLKPLEILLADDNPGDVRLFIESLKDGKVLNHLNVTWDGEEAINYLKQKVAGGLAPRPDFVILDINMPKMTGTRSPHRDEERCRSNEHTRSDTHLFGSGKRHDDRL